MDACNAISRSFVHDLKNHIGGISGAAELLNIDAGEHPSTRELTQLILSACDNAIGALNNYSEFLNGEERCDGLLDVHAFLERQLAFYQACLSKNISVSLKRGAAEAYIAMHADMLAHIGMNIVLNVKDAISERGSLTISTTTLHLNEHTRPPFQQVPAGTWLDLCYTDTGCGMNKKTLEQAHTPHFSSKPRHIGMGLTLVHDCMRQHKGYLCIESSNTSGTRIHLLFPQSPPYQ